MRAEDPIAFRVGVQFVNAPAGRDTAYSRKVRTQGHKYPGQRTMFDFDIVDMILQQLHSAIDMRGFIDGLRHLAIREDDSCHRNTDNQQGGGARKRFDIERKGHRVADLVGFETASRGPSSLAYSNH